MIGQEGNGGLCRKAASAGGRLSDATGRCGDKATIKRIETANAAQDSPSRRNIRNF